MTDRTTLPLEAHDNRSVFLSQAWNIGRAYRNQAMELISICQLLSRIAPPKFAHEHAELRRMRRVCDLALRSAADSGTKVTDEANARFKEATQVLSKHLERTHPLDLPLTPYSKMEIAKWKDISESNWPHSKSDECAPTMTVNFILLQSPLQSPHGPETVIVSQELGAGSSLPEILWNFSRYKDRARVTLEQNPHFYLRCPIDESTFTPRFQRYPLQDPSGALEHNDNVYVLFDRPCRVFLDIEHKPRIFGNVWLLNGFLVFRDISGVLEGEQLVKSSSIRGKLWYREQPVLHHDSDSGSRLDHRCLRPIVTTPSANPSLERTFDDWTVLSRPGSHRIDTHIYGSRGSTSTLDRAPSPPTSERPGYNVLYTTINRLNDDILLSIFNYYRLHEKNAYEVRLWWRGATSCIPQYSTWVLDTLDHLPPLPLFVDYRYISGQDELGIYHALLLRDRVRRVDLHLLPSILRGFLPMLMGVPFPVLAHLSLSSTADDTPSLTLPKTFMAPNLRHLVLLGIGLPIRLRLLSSTVSLVTLVLTNIQATGYFRPRLLVARLQSLPQLEELSIGFSIPIPRPSTEEELLGNQGPPVTLRLKCLMFKGVSAYLERFVAQIRAPLLERLDITLFNQIAFALPHLTHFANITKGLKLPVTNVFFGYDQVTIAICRSTPQKYAPFQLRVRCKQLDWQIDCAAQVCSALMPALLGVEKLTLDLYGRMMPTEWRNGEIDGTTWHELLKSFVGAKELRICRSLSGELSRALQMEGVGSDAGLLPDLQELACVSTRVFDHFIHARRVAGRPIRWHRLGGAIPSSGRHSMYPPVRIPSTTPGSFVMVPPPSIFSLPPEPSSSETTEDDDDVASSIASSNDTFTTPPPSRKRSGRSRRPNYDPAPAPPGLDIEYPITPLMRGDALPTLPPPQLY
ncbi:hypothetical protein H4582DRAFT_2142014 [Lactarius indigo]|nr:hypothetical protein H4582DRAFT_2142014 [Lactarius indigo]